MVYAFLFFLTERASTPTKRERRARGPPTPLGARRVSPRRRAGSLRRVGKAAAQLRARFRRPVASRAKLAVQIRYNEHTPTPIGRTEAMKMTLAAEAVC